jgi:hypothetical protein
MIPARFGERRLAIDVWMWMDTLMSMMIAGARGDVPFFSREKRPACVCIQIPLASPLAIIIPTHHHPSSINKQAWTQLGKYTL